MTSRPWESVRASEAPRDGSTLECILRQVCVGWKACLESNNPSAYDGRPEELRLLLTFTRSKFPMARSTSQSLFFRQSSANCRFRRVRRMTSCMRPRCGCGYKRQPSQHVQVQSHIVDKVDIFDGGENLPEAPGLLADLKMARSRRTGHASVQASWRRSKSNPVRQARRRGPLHPNRFA